MKNNTPFVSVVTPVHNGEKYLGKAIESILGQTFAFNEYIIVDNRSTDRTPEILHDYARKDNRIRVYTNRELLPAMENQSHSMRLISDQSVYCKVLHADDMLYPQCIASMVNLAEKYPSVGIVSSYRINGNKVTLDGIDFHTSMIKGNEVCRRTLLESGFYVFGNPSNILLRSSLVRKREDFYHSSFFGDVEACFDLLKESDFGFVHQVLSFTRIHNESISSSLDAKGRTPLGMISVLIKYGPDYLTRQEYDVCLKYRMGVYYRFLGRSLLRNKGREFWKYQEDWLEGIGLRVDKKKVILSALGVILTNITRPSQYGKIFDRKTSLDARIQE